MVCLLEYVLFDGLVFRRTEPTDRADEHRVWVMTAAIFRLRKHADYQRVYKSSRKQFAKQMSYFFALRPALGADGMPQRDANGDAARVGLTVGKVMGKAVDRNRIKRRMREAVRRQLPALQMPVDVVLHPKRSVIDLEFAVLEREVATVFRAIKKAAERQMDRAPEGVS
jgi:ribonuclease P protein component